MELLSLLQWSDPVEILRMDHTSEGLQLHVITLATSATCPKCGNLSSRQHSHYQRKLADLPWAGKPVIFYLKLQRFFCDHPICSQKTFALSLTSVLRYARQTSRLQYQLVLIASQLGGRAGAKLALLLGMPTSRDILLRLMMQLPQVSITPPRILGVDDWSIKKDTSYATIFVDIEKQRPVELLPGREAATLATWLKNHPGVEVITRDRASSYTEGATKGAPNALQVADRWHLGAAPRLKNLGEALKRMLEKHTVQLRTSARELAEKQQQAKHQEQLAASAQREVVGPSISLSSATASYALRFKEAKRLLSEDHSLRAVSRILGMSRKTIDRYRYLDTYPAKSFSKRSSTVLPWKEYLIERWNNGEHNQKQLWREIQAQGFTGGHLCVHRFFAHFSDGTKSLSLPELEIKNWSTSRVQFLLSKPEEKITEEEMAFLKVFFQHCQQAAFARTLALEFHAIFREKRAHDLSTWIQQAKNSRINALKNFAIGLESDYAAVEAAATYQWSNGPVEGHVNRLKTIKRQMFGRAGFDLLRKRVLFYLDTG